MYEICIDHYKFSADKYINKKNSNDYILFTPHTPCYGSLIWINSIVLKGKKARKKLEELIKSGYKKEVIRVPRNEHSIWTFGARVNDNTMKPCYWNGNKAGEHIKSEVFSYYIAV